MKINRILITLIFTLFVMAALAEDIKYVVKPGDTLYSLSHKHNVTVEDILAANPSIVETNIPVGMTLIIPMPKSEQVVGEDKTVVEEVEEQEKKEKKGFFANLFGKKKRNKNGNEENDELAAAADSVTEVEPDTIVVNKRVKAPGTSDNIVVILPFKLDAKSGDDERLQMRSVEFYEGFLLAVKEAQAAGQRILVQTYDLGTKSMGEILATQSLMDADLIIAPMELAEMQVVAEFAKENDINVVSPFAFNETLSQDNKNLIQLNTSKSLLYDDLTDDILKRFDGYEFVFLKDNVLISKSDQYAEYLRNAMNNKGLKFHEFAFDNPERLAKVDTLLNIVGKDILYIPVVNSKEALQKMFPCLQCTTFDPELGQLTKGQTAILGYPEWMLYAADFMDYYYDQNVYMFSKFYVNPFDEDVKKFYEDFRYWYAKEPMPLTPRYALLGYDVGRYFLAAVHQHGRDLQNNLEYFSKHTLQSMMSYRHNGEGFINKGLYLVHFLPSAIIEKYEIK